MRIPLWIALLAAAACGQRSEISTAVRQTIAETRSKPQLMVVMQVDDDELRKSVERRIEDQHVGTIKSEAAGPGHLDFTVEVESTVEDIPRIREILKRADVLAKSTIRVLQ